MNTEQVGDSVQGRASSTTASQEQGWIELARHGDAKAFEWIYHRYARRIFNVALRMTNDSSAAEDITQEVFLTLHRKLSTFRGEAKFSTWLFGIAVNACLMHLRRGRSRDQGVQELAYSGGMGPEPSSRAEVPGYRQVVLKRAIASLPEGYRAILVLHDLAGFPHEEIARIRNCSPGTSRSQLCKARRTLRESLAANRWHFDEEGLI